MFTIANRSMSNTASATDDEAAPGADAPDGLEENELHDYNSDQLEN